MKRIIALLLCAIMILGVSVGCASNKENTDQPSTEKETSTENQQKETAETTEELSFPLKEPVKLSMFVRTRERVDDFVNNEFTKWLEEKTNIQFEFIVATKENEKEKLSLLLATGDYPDIIASNELNYSQQALYGAQGILLPLNNLIEKYGENTKKVFEQYPTAKKITTAADGNIYNLPLVNDCYHCKSAQKMWIYKPWLDEAGLDLPQTTEEFQEILRIFAARGDEVVPLIGCDVGWKSQVYSFLMNPFVYYSHDAKGLFVQDGNVVPSYTQDGWKEGLKYLQGLRKEGLLATESFTIDKNGVKQIGNNPDEVILGAFPYGYVQGIISGSTPRWLDYVAVPPLKGPDGIQLTEYMPYKNDFLPALSITNKCENPEVAMMLADLLYSEEVGRRALDGREGIEWQYATDGVGINGEPAIHEMLIEQAEHDYNIKWDQTGNTIRSNDYRLGEKVKTEESLEVVLYNETRDKYVDYRPSADEILPPLPFNEEQSTMLVSYDNAIEDFYKEKIAYFVLGDVDIDAEWDGYIKQLENMGLDKLLEIYQESYDANFK